MKKWCLFFPYIYGFNTRAKTMVHRLSFIALVFMPIYLHVLMMTNNKFPFGVFIVGFSAMYATYEIGYIYNDVFTVIKEMEPTKWLSMENNCFVQDKYPLLISSRVIWILICILILIKFQIENALGFVICLCLIHFVFSLHNYFRGIENIFTNGGLQILKYISVLLLFGTGINLMLHCFFICIEIAFERTIEYALTRGYIIKKIKLEKIDTFRIIYYLILSFAVLGLFFLNKRFISFLIISIYLLLYRIICKLLISNKKISKSRAKQ